MGSAEKMLGQAEGGKCSKIAKIFTDSYKISLCWIVIDDVERIPERIPMGPRFSNAILQGCLIFDCFFAFFSCAMYVPIAFK